MKLTGAFEILSGSMSLKFSLQTERKNYSEYERGQSLSSTRYILN